MCSSDLCNTPAAFQVYFSYLLFFVVPELSYIAFVRVFPVVASYAETEW